MTTLRIDAHQHFWNYSAAEYPLIPAASPLERNWLPQDLDALQKPLGLHGSIAVQARQSLEESRWLLELAGHHSSIKGVVGWVDLRNAAVDEQLAQFAKHPRFRGVRHVVQDEPDDRFMLGEAFLHGISRLKHFNLTYDILIYPKQLPAAIELVKRFPEQPFVLDHIAKPHIRDGRLEPWATHIRELAKAPNVSCKVSGMVTEADWTAWKADDFKPYLDVVFDAFGAKRLMFGSDWPVCLLAGSYERVFKLTADYMAQFNPEEQAGFLGGNAAKFYGVG